MKTKASAWKNDLLLLVCTSGACAFLLFYRIQLSGSYYYSFLVWNLFLAFIPLLISWRLNEGTPRWKLFAMGFVWLLFLPNAPYLITDIIHLRPRHISVPLWFDGLLLFAFAFAGNWMGLRSMERWMQHLKISTNTTWVIPAFFALGALIGYGVFMGRILRFNSWDLFTRPLVVLENAWFYLDDPRAVLMSCSFSVVLTCSYFVYAKMKEDYAPQLPNVY